MKTIFSIIFLTFLLPLGQNKTTELSGIYYSVDNKFEKWSIMELRENGTFKYKYGLSACQGDVTGTYTVNSNRIQFKNDKEFTKEYLEKERDSLNSIFPGIGIPVIPDLSLTEWKIKKNSIKPISEIDCGCIIEKGKHKKR
ncbi:hypothetical protein FJ651_15395 [Paucihalobacter ruber]|uniref:Uncharacterized protein n=1 Tax=Paucihalobacter ruber TaxID=2567861 RepID=A0A506PC61_9FLAO|nr:hypothetical protein [Paucihalobacter ruber]TPV31169.1 hypothetical protein FJ651_15395 [Paucihalobacter ruber]